MNKLKRTGNSCYVTKNEGKTWEKTNSQQRTKKTIYYQHSEFYIFSI